MADSTGELRAALVDTLRAQGTVRSRPVEAALRAVPRHLFLPGVPLRAAYADGPVRTKDDGTGEWISAASQPTMVAIMLEQLDVRPGQRVLEIGAGTGYNAALLAHLAGLGRGEAAPGAGVATVDVDDDIVEAARAHLADAGYGDVEVVLGDGALGHPPAAPYDRLIATVGTWDVPPAWPDQVAPGGRMVIPLRLRGAVSRSLAFDRAAGSLGDWVSRSGQMCSFMPLRGAADDARRSVDVSGDGSVTLAVHRDQEPDPSALAAAVRRPPADAWTGVTLAAGESPEWLDLWLTCVLPDGLYRIDTRPAAVESGRVRPWFTWGAPAAVDGAALAYLTARRVAGAPGRPDGHEIGVVAHGPGTEGGRLAETVADRIREWDRAHRSAAVVFTLRPGGGTTPLAGPFVFTTPHAQVAVTWAGASAGAEPGTAGGTVPPPSSDG